MTNDFISLFNYSVNLYPDKTALQYFSEKLTYKQLALLSNQVALTIINQDIPPQSPIILEVEKSLMSIVYILGILKAGCYYIPVATNIPVNRLHFLLENSQSQMAFLHHHYDELSTTEGLKCLFIEKDLSALEGREESRFDKFNSLSINPSDPACCLYTSGSTGYPKGVLISHMGLSTFFEDVKPIMNMSHKSICLNTAPFIFDVSIIDTFFLLLWVLQFILHLKSFYPTIF